MFVETLHSISTNEEVMKLDNSMEEPDDDDDDDVDIVFPPLPSNIDLPSYGNTPDPYDNRHHTMDLFYCPTPPFPSPPPPPPPSAATMTRMYANARTFSSIRMHDSTSQQPMVSFATQQRKKPRAPIASFIQSVYVNLPRPRSPPSKPVNLANEVTYATLLNTTSLVPILGSDVIVNHVEYQQIQHQCGRKVSIPIYENVKPRRPPPPPLCSPTNTPLRPASWSIIPLENDQPLTPVQQNNNRPVSSSSGHIYINLEYQNDKPPALPTRTNKSVRIAVQTTTATPPPPAIPPRNELREAIRRPSSTVATSLVENDPDAYETTSNTSTTQTVKAFPVNKSPTCGEKSDLYRTKAPLTTTENIPSFASARQRRIVQSARRRRLRGSVALRTGVKEPADAQTKRQQNPRPNSNVNVRHPMTTDDRWRRTLHKRRRQRAVQMKLDGNVLNKPKKTVRLVTDHTYNEIKQPPLPNNHTTNAHHGAAGGVLERAMQFNGALRDRVFSWYRGANHPGREAGAEQTAPQIFSTSENGESDQKDSNANGTADGEDGEEEEEFFTHDTFEDFLLRRRPKSVNSTTTTSGTSTIVSHLEPTCDRAVVRKIPLRKPPAPPLPPAPPPPLPPSPPPSRRFPGLALSLDKTDVDFIHNILQRTRGDHRVWNRITALKEAYIRATSKKNDAPKKAKPNITEMDDKKKKKAMTMKHSLAATKIRAELEKYDELPPSSPTVLDDDYYDHTCSANIPQKNDPHPHHRSAPTLPRTPSTAHRFLSFVTSIKRRAQDNVQQLQKNLHEIRSRIHVESMANAPQQITIQRHTSTVSRHRQTFKDLPNTPRMPSQRRETTSNQASIVRRANSHHSATSTDHSNRPHRRQFSRTQSNASQLPQQQRHTFRQQQRSTNEKISSTVNQSPSLNNRPPPPPERRSLRRAENEGISRPQRSKKNFVD